MKTVAYCHPLVPSEWIESHGLRAAWLVPHDVEAAAEAGPLTGTCPFARAVGDTLASPDEVGLGAEPLAVLTTTCDQMRRMSGILDETRPGDVFLLNVPSTRQSPASREYYANELRRLGRWLVARGGQSPSAERLANAMRRQDAAREAFRRGERPADAPTWCNPVAMEFTVEAGRNGGADGVVLGLIGGPLRRRDLAVARCVRAAGGRIVLDATTGGVDLLPAAFDPTTLARDPFDELVRAYFDELPAVFDRPNDRLHAWIARRVAERGVRGLLCLRHVWCDLWHAALPRLKETAGVPILDIDLGDELRGGESRLAERIEAMIESLRQD
ncbi:MAG TPA: 2-hydroxyacyl-CoA dehydratase family protein [Thermoguttaceae bacterium]|nr:2-hydroxyacyl-CoA dehydratase family protein [Thermoguttaceae bacterium]